MRTVDLAGHTPGHTGYLLGEGDATVLFWGDTVHSHSVQLRRPSVAAAADSDEHAAIGPSAKLSTSRRRIDGGWAPPICPSRAWGTFAATSTAIAGWRSRTHRSRHGPPSQMRRNT